MTLRNLAVAALGVAALGIAAPAAATVSVVNINGTNGDGTTVSLAAGTYTVTYAGIAGGGLYDAYSPWGSNSGCNELGENCSTGFTAPFAIDFGHGTANFDRVDGFTFGLIGTPQNSNIYATPEQALAAYSAANLVYAALPVSSDQNAYTTAPKPYTFTLGSAQSVNFFIKDNPYSDNRLGVSLALDDGIVASGGIPEPATWAMMILGMGGAGAMLRRRRAGLLTA